MKDNRLLKVLWGIVVAIFLCSALFIGISYFTGGDSSSKKKDEETTSSSKSKDKDKDKEKNNSKSKTKEKSDEEKYRENKESNGNTSSSSNSSKSESNKPTSNSNAVSNSQNSNNTNTTNNSNKDDKKEVTEANGGAIAPGTFSSADAAKAYANEEVNRLAKENKKRYSYILENNNKGEVVVKITQG